MTSVLIPSPPPRKQTVRFKGVSPLRGILVAHFARVHMLPEGRVAAAKPPAHVAGLLGRNPAGMLVGHFGVAFWWGMW